MGICPLFLYYITAIQENMPLFAGHLQGYEKDLSLQERSICILINFFQGYIGYIHANSSRITCVLLSKGNPGTCRR